MYYYKIIWSYWQDGRRIKDQDVFHGDNTQEAVDTCRAEYINEFADCFGRIEEVYKECPDCWDYRDDWE